MYHTNCIEILQGHSGHLHLDGVFAFRLTVVDTEHLGPFDVIEATLAVREGA